LLDDAMQEVRRCSDASSSGPAELWLSRRENLANRAPDALQREALQR
jgi:hypothetical protein